MKYYLVRIRLNSQGYDHFGTYWGRDIPLYRYESADGQDFGHVRAPGRATAKLRVQNWLGNSPTFFR